MKFLTILVIVATFAAFAYAEKDCDVDCPPWCGCEYNPYKCTCD